MKNYKLSTLLIFIGFLFFGCYMPYISDLPTDDNSQQSDSLSGDIWLITYVDTNSYSYNINWKYYNDSTDYEYTYEYSTSYTSSGNTNYSITTNDYFYTTSAYLLNCETTTSKTVYNNDDNEFISSESSTSNGTTTLFDNISFSLTESYNSQTSNNTKVSYSYNLELIDNTNELKIYNYYLATNPDNYSLYYIENENISKIESYNGDDLISKTIYESQNDEILNSINLRNTTTYNNKD